MRIAIATLLASLTLAFALGSLSCGPSRNATVDISMPPDPDSTLTPLFAKCGHDTCSCACDDPFDPRIRADTGDFGGLCLNTCAQRSVRLLDSADNERYGYFARTLRDSVGGDMLMCVNVSHMDSAGPGRMFCAAMVPLDGVRDVILQLEFAGGLQAHAQLRFVLDSTREALLVAQNTSWPRKTYRVRDIVFSAEAVAPPGMRYKGDYAMRGQYYQSLRFETLKPRADKMMGALHHPVAQYRVGIGPAYAARVLTVAAHLADSLQFTLRYHTIQRNCILECFNAIDGAVVPPWWRQPLLLVTNRSLFMPTRAPRHLWYRGLVDRSDFRRADFQVEMGMEQSIDTALAREFAKVSRGW